MNKLLFLVYVCLVYVLYIITRRHYDVDGTTITIKKLDNPLDIKSLEDLSIVPVFNNDEYAVIDPIEELIHSTKREYHNSFYIELDGKDRITAISPWDSYLELSAEARMTIDADFDNFRLDKTPQKQLEFGKIVGMDDTKIVHYDKHDIVTLDTTPTEIGCLNDILKHVKPSLKKFYKNDVPDSFVVSVNKINFDKATNWEQAGRFHQDVVPSIATFRRPYTKSTAKHISRDIRMIIVHPDSYDESGITEFAKSIEGEFASHVRLDSALNSGSGRGHTALSSEKAIDIIKIDKGDKPLIGVLFDNHKIFHATPRTSLGFLEFMLKKAKIRTLYQVTFSDGFFGAITAASKKKKKKKKKKTKSAKSAKRKAKKSKKKPKKYKVEFEK